MVRGGRWSERSAAADKAVKTTKTTVKIVQSRGQKVPDKFHHDHGEAATKAADLRQAAKNEKNGDNV